VTELASAFLGVMIVLQSVTLEPVFTVGENDGPPETTFGRVVDAVFDTEGVLLIVDASDAHIRRIDVSGQPTGMFGRSGRGPRELHRPVAAEWLDSTVAITHSGTVSEFTTEGAFVDSWRLPGYGFSKAIPLDRERRAVLRAGVAGASSVDPRQIVSVIGAGEDVRLATGSSGGVFVRHETGSVAFDAGLCGTLSISYLGNGAFLIGNGREGTVTRFEDATEVRSYRVSPPAGPLPSEKKEEVASLLRRSSSLQRARSVEVMLPPYLSTVCGMEVEHAERIWVHVATEEDTEQWRALALGTGELSTRLDLPVNHRLLAAHDGRIAAAWETDLDVTRITVFRLRDEK